MNKKIKITVFPLGKDPIRFQPFGHNLLFNTRKEAFRFGVICELMRRLQSINHHGIGTIISLSYQSQLELELENMESFLPLPNSLVSIFKIEVKPANTKMEAMAKVYKLKGYGYSHTE